MNVQPFLDISLAALVIGVALFTIIAKDEFSAVTAYVAYGIFLAIVWVRLYAPDVALTEAAVGGGVTGVLLVMAGKRLDASATIVIARKPSAAFSASVAVCSILLAGSLAAVIMSLPDPAPSLAPQAAAAAQGPGAGLGNPITAVLMSYRSFDTMLEKVVLILAVVGVWSVGADEAWGEAPAPFGPAAPSDALLFLARTLPPIGGLIGVHIFWTGADEPGGAFQGGALLAAMWMVAMMARLADPPAINSRWLRVALISGPAVFLVIGVAGAMLAGHFFAYPPALAKPLILFIETFMLLSIAVALPMLVAGPAARKGAR
jgi:multisubunit Na+/H+ antiporter MnhB subunit